ncbi:NAD(P)/FAD-dependent oxidoreductase [Treponema bryantii]|uniref:NAD(P)/FAD-dependent oxidoreductase n=1 Tax=Treponema bryantii TaxID=163 RepID=UPI0003B6C6BA|nr:FAD-dependent monooxygenase [Treponema bryantii]
MIKEITITVEARDEKNSALRDNLIRKELKKNHIKDSQFETVFVKKSIDARHGQLKLHLRYKVYIGEKPDSAGEWNPLWKSCAGAGPERTVIIVGAGPAGLFGALKLLESGIKPVIIERGTQTSQRRKDIALISTRGQVNGDSNYCFGEGGAGTFSDGKLYTRSNKRGDIGSILRIFNYFGADEKILTDAHPHIGTDRLPQVINAMRDKIIELGGEFHFNERVTALVTESKDGKLCVKGVETQNVESGEKGCFYGKAVLLATGHSATDIYKMLAKLAPDSLEAKTFAAGVRVEHPRSLIDSIQYHGRGAEAGLGAAEYRVTTQVDGRGVYSFCMCPGGFVVPSSSGPDEIVVNGMSAAARNSKWSNAAIVVEIRPEDIPESFKAAAEKAGCPQLAGLFFRREIEKLAFENGNGQAAPAQRLTDFLAGRKSADLPASSYTPGLVSSELGSWLPSHISERLKKGFKQIDQSMHGFISDEALMIAPETRTSTPVRILRDKETYECNAIGGLYPAGEGSGYSGGIVSSAMDGENACARIAEIIK